MTLGPRTGILVAGMHRSGTSAVTRLISLLGAELPDHLMAAHQDYNASGFWESTEVVALNEHILGLAGSGWDDVLPVDHTALAPDTLADIGRRIDGLLQSQFHFAATYVLKDPRLSRLLPLWLPSMGARGDDVRIVLPLRHPAEVAASLARRDGFDTNKALHLWLRHNIDTLRLSAGAPCAIIRYDEVLRDWRSSVAQLASDLGLDWPRALDAAAEEIDAFLAPSLRHHTCDGDLDGAVAPLAMELYDALLTRPVAIPELADTFHRKLLAIEQTFSPMLKDCWRRQVQAELARDAAQQALAESNREFTEKCEHVASLEALLTSERQTYRNLEAEFLTKCRHIELLMGEVSQLKQLTERLRQSSGASAFSERFARDLEEIADLAERRDAQLKTLRDENARLLQQQRLCREDIVRAEAQLELLKTLLLEQ